MTLTLLIILVAILAVMLICFGLAYPLVQEDAVHTRLAQFSERPRTLEQMELTVPFSERVLRPMSRRMAGVMMKGDKNADPRQLERKTSAIQARLNLAGNPHHWTPTDYIGVKGLFALLFAVLALLIVAIAGYPAAAFLAAIVGGIFGYIAPELYLGRMIASRQHMIQKVMPDTIDLLVICVEAGLGFDSALTRVVQKSDNPLTYEFGRVLSEMRVGRPRRDALKDVITRTQVPDLANFISAILQAEQLGVSVTQVLAVQADQMRVLRRQRAQEKAMQAPIKMLFPMVFFIFPALCFVLMGPIWPQMAKSQVPI
jgi:tight adherence protein C